MNSIRLQGVEYNLADIEKLVSAKSFLSLPVWQQKIYEFLSIWWSAEEFIIQHTSGSTGAPKPIKLSKASMIASAKRTCGYFSLTESSKLGLCLSADYIAGKMMIVRAIVSGADLQTVAPEGKGLLDFVGRIDFIAMVPLQASSMLALKDKNFEVKQVLLGGADISSSLQEKIALTTNTRFFLGYGMTETCSHIAIRYLGSDNLEYETMTGVELSVDERNCLVIDDKVLGLGPLMTNDVITILPNGFVWCGRWDNIINSGGIKFVPEEIEHKISHLVTEPFLITSQPDERLGNRIVLVVENEFGSELDKNNILNEISSILPKYSVPKEILFVKKIYRTPNGKVDRRFSYF